MTALITRGSATGTALAMFLRAANRDVVFASRSRNRIPEGFDHVKFDWTDSSTFETPFASGRDIQYVYLLLAGSGWDPLPVVNPFVDFTAEKGVKRLVVLSASGQETEKGPESMSLGRVHTYLNEKGMHYGALRPTSFSANFLRDAADIKQYSELRSIRAKGRVPFIAAQDIAQAAFLAITDIQSLPCNEPVLIGPELVSCDEVAEAFSKSLARTITHHIISEEDLVKRYMHQLPEEYARMVVEPVERGVEEVHLTDKRRWVGRIGIREWIETHEDAFV